MSVGSTVRTVPLMGTMVTIEVVEDAESEDFSELDSAIERAFDWFQRVEECCTRFDSQSELMKLTAQVGVAVPVSSILFEAVKFALSVAEESDGAFDPTVGHTMESRGFNREYSTATVIRTPIEPGEGVSYRDVELDPERRTITLLSSLVLDLGAVAKGMAIDLAARELKPFRNFSVDAGGDLYLGGLNRQQAPWSIGIRHPREHDALIDTVRVSDCAVCSSGDYERRVSGNSEHHILDPRSQGSAWRSASVTVIAPTAMAADALATAAFVMGATDGMAFLNRLGVDGLIVTPDLNKYATEGMIRDYCLGASALL